MKLKVSNTVFTIVDSEVSGVYNVLDEKGFNVQSILGSVAFSDVINFLRKVSDGRE